MAEDLLRAIAETMRAELGNVSSRLDAFEDRLTRAESRGLAYRGVWDALETYRIGDVVTFNGSMWVARTPTTGDQPGLSTEASRAWTLAVKRGADGRPGKDAKS